MLATAPGTPAVLMQGTLRSNALTITGLGDGPKLMDCLVGKRPVANTSTSTNTAEAPAKDVIVKKKKSSLNDVEDTIAGHDSRKTARTLRQGSRN